MALGRTTLLAFAAALAVAVPTAGADTPLPDARTHVDPAGANPDPEAPKLTLLESDTDSGDVRRGYLYVRARCDARCEVEVTATTKISGKWREIATATKTLPANRVRRIKLKIRSNTRRRLAAGATFRFTAVPFPPFDG